MRLPSPIRLVRWVVRTDRLRLTNGASRAVGAPQGPESGTLRGAGAHRRSTRKDGPARMWNRLLDRIAPLMDEDISDLDRRDGVGTRSAHERIAENQPARNGSVAPRR